MLPVCGRNNRSTCLHQPPCVLPTGSVRGERQYCREYCFLSAHVGSLLIVRKPWVPCGALFSMLPATGNLHVRHGKPLCYRRVCRRCPTHMQAIVGKRYLRLSRRNLHTTLRSCREHPLILFGLHHADTARPRWLSGRFLPALPGDPSACGLSIPPRVQSHPCREIRHGLFLMPNIPMPRFH